MEDRVKLSRFKLAVAAASGAALAVLITIFLLGPAAGLRFVEFDTARPIPTDKIYRLSEFQRAFVGKSKREVIASLGTPLAVNSGIEPGTQTYDYSPSEKFAGQVNFRVIDDTTGLEQQFVMIRFGATGYAEGFSY